MTNPFRFFLTNIVCIKCLSFDNVGHSGVRVMYMFKAFISVSLGYFKVASLETVGKVEIHFPKEAPRLEIKSPHPDLHLKSLLLTEMLRL